MTTDGADYSFSASVQDTPTTPAEATYAHSRGRFHSYGSLNDINDEGEVYEEEDEEAKDQTQ